MEKEIRPLIESIIIKGILRRIAVGLQKNSKQIIGEVTGLLPIMVKLKPSLNGLIL